MDEPVRWVTKAEAAQELEVSVSTLVGPVTADPLLTGNDSVEGQGAAQFRQTMSGLRLTRWKRVPISFQPMGHFKHVDGIVWVRVTGG